jgi:flagellar protein FlaG
MSFEIGPLQPIGRGNPVRRVDAVTPGFSLDLARRKTQTAAAAEPAVVALPPSPPDEVRDAIGAAAARAAELRAENRELHFRKDQTSGRVIVEVRDLAGNVIRTIPPSTALDVMAGARI